MNEILKEEILNLGSDNLHYFGGKYEGGIHLQQNISEITNLIEFLINEKKNFKNFLEVGSAAGGNTFILNKYFNFEKIIIVDDNNHPKYNLRKEILKDLKYSEFVGNSQTKEANDWVKNLNIKFDLMFIDADHSYNGVKNDTYNFLEFLNSGGYLMFHDTLCMEGVKQWCNQLKEGVIDDLLYLNTFFSEQDNTWPKGISIFQKI